MATMSKYEEYRNFAIQTARDAGAVILEWYEKELDLQTKSSEFDLVTQADKAAEALIVERIHRRYPASAILAEEAGEIARESEHRWIIDPLDGTTNFASAFPHFCVSIALQENDQPVVGVIYDPLRDELFWAERGEGAWLQSPRGPERRLHVGSSERLATSLLATGFSYSRASTETDNVLEFERVIRRIRGIRRAGSAALDLAYVAAGRLDGYWEYHMQPWDTAAGALLVEEAGGELRQIDGSAWDPWMSSTVTANPVLLPVLLAALRGTDLVGI
jgi:myo-inositol-1(or 4)-monophosphatase